MFWSQVVVAALALLTITFGVASGELKSPLVVVPLSILVGFVFPKPKDWIAKFGDGE